MSISLIFNILAFIVICVLIFIILSKNSRLNQTRGSLLKLKKSFNELDEQAKLIVKTDLELNKAQEESDKRLGGLEALHKTSRLISTTLDENEIFHRLNESLQTNLDFDKMLILFYDERKQLKPRVNVGYAPEGIEYILNGLKKDSSLLEALTQGHIFSSVAAATQRKKAIQNIFGSEHFVLSPILTQNGLIGIAFVGNQSSAAAVTEGDEEILSILANQIGQSLENARLFEQVYRSSRALESKVQDRTKQLEDALAEVKKISKTKSDFISAVSHELRTPLTSIKGYAAILITGKLGEIPEKVKERLEKINLHSDNLVNLINELLDISRIESGRVEMKMTEHDLRQTAENVHDLLTPQMKNKNINWELNVDKNVPNMIYDSSQVERIFINLVGNAVKFTPENGTISVKATWDKEKDLVEIGVSDTGIGIPEDDLGKLFSEFFRVDNKINQNVKGTGLGLALAKKIVEAHHGEIWVTSTVNQGTTFHFTLPVKPKKAEAPAAQPAQPSKNK
ncbi:MAG TPA: GAF domain-containing sensor histidine kinase [Candidatus Omnitrophota bacterium]|nr:GAF domain-containing sensor histidine kinase [Candidatus Omnitrophota bacterium]